MSPCPIRFAHPIELRLARAPDRPGLLPVAADRRPGGALPADRRHAGNARAVPRAARPQRSADRAVRPLRLGRAAPRLRREPAPGASGASTSCSQAFVWTLWLAVITMVLVTIAAIVIGSLAAFRPGGVFDRLVTFISLIGASAPGLLDRHRRHHRLRHRPRLAADLRHRHGLALDPADRGAVHPAVRPDPPGGARLDGPGLRLGLRQDGPRQGRRRPLDHLRPRAAQRHAAGHHRHRRPGGGACSTARWSSRRSSASPASAS